MVYKKIKNSQSSLALVIFLIIFSMGIFYAGFYWIEANAEESGRVVDAMYNDSFTSLKAEEGSLNTTIQGIKDGITGVTEADSTFGAALNGLKGLLNVFKLPLNLVSIGWQVVQATLAPVTSLFPSWAASLIEIGVITFIVLIILAILKGDSKIIN
jgi:hypothetical protein